MTQQSELNDFNRNATYVFEIESDEPQISSLPPGTFEKYQEEWREQSLRFAAAARALLAAGEGALDSFLQKAYRGEGGDGTIT